LSTLPVIEAVKAKAGKKRHQLLEYYNGKERLKGLIFEENRKFFYWLFYRRDNIGTHYRIYITNMVNIRIRRFIISLMSELLAYGLIREKLSIILKMKIIIC